VGQQRESGLRGVDRLPPFIESDAVANISAQ